MVERDIYLPVSIYHLAITGLVTDKDIEVILKVHPRLKEVLDNYGYYSKRYRETVVIKYIKELLSKYRREDIASQIRLLVALLTTIPEKRLRYYAPYIAQLIAIAERKAREAGIMDTQLEKVFDKMYESLHKDRVRVNEVITNLLRVLVHTQTTVSKEIQPAEGVITEKEEKAEVDKYLVEFVKVVNELYKKNKKVTIIDAINEFFTRYQKELGEMPKVYNIMREAIKRGYIEKTGKGYLIITDAGKELIR